MSSLIQSACSPRQGGRTVAIRFTRHAEEKFALLAQHGFVITREQVENAVIRPDRVDEGRRGRLVAERVVSRNHVVRVVYVEDNGARRGRYAD